MKKLFVNLIFTTLFLFLIGCASDYDAGENLFVPSVRLDTCNFDDSFINQEYISKIDSDIIMEMREVGTEFKRNFHINFWTKKHYSSFDCPIKFCMSKNKNRIIINLSYVLPVSPYPAFGPAVCRINIGELQNGKYEIEINIAGKISKGNLIVKDGSYELQFKTQKQLVISNYVLNRIPNNTIWGRIGYHGHSITHVNDVLKKFEEAGAEKINLKKGNYYSFIINSNSQIICYDCRRHSNSEIDCHSCRNVFHFIYKFTGDDFSKLEEIVNYYKKGIGIHIQLYSTKQNLDWIYN